MFKVFIKEEKWIGKIQNNKVESDWYYAVMKNDSNY